MAGKKILVAPLDWGLGHATRCIPVIRALLDAGNEVMIAADGRIEKLLREEFPQLEFIYLKGYRLSYSNFFPAWLAVIFMLPKIFFRMWSEHAQLKKIIREHKINVVISDSRFGLWNRNVCSVYITHQLMIKCPPGLKFFEPVLHAIHAKVIKNYNHCWIPDYEGQKNLSGDLSHQYPLSENSKFIGPLSRFKSNNENDIKYGLCFVVSGPEPSRTSFEKIIFAALQQFSGNAIVVLGKPGEKRDEIVGGIRIVSHLNSESLEKILCASAFIVCRSGYSSVMDLVAMKKNALLVPTPGQTEQEYLADYLSESKIFASTKQSAFTLKNISRSGFFSVENLHPAKDGLTPLVNAILEFKDR